jgi:hypothetical protein
VEEIITTVTPAQLLAGLIACLMQPEETFHGAARRLGARYIGTAKTALIKLKVLETGTGRIRLARNRRFVRLVVNTQDTRSSYVWRQLEQHLGQENLTPNHVYNLPELAALWNAGAIPPPEYQDTRVQALSHREEILSRILEPASDWNDPAVLRRHLEDLESVAAFFDNTRCLVAARILHTREALERIQKEKG